MASEWDDGIVVGNGSPNNSNLFNNPEQFLVGDITDIQLTSCSSCSNISAAADSYQDMVDSINRLEEEMISLKKQNQLLISYILANAKEEHTSKNTHIHSGGGYHI